MNTDRAQKRLPRNFHCTFKPERQYINALLRYAASGQLGDYNEIARATGIPMGRSSGKVPAILDYCKGMGLIKSLSNDKKVQKKQPVLTDFGRIVLLDDPYLKSDITQWIAHFNLCNPITGADIWYYTFYAGNNSLGNRFKRIDLENYLKLQYQDACQNLIGPLVGMYEDESAFKVCGALAESNKIIIKKEAPIRDEVTRGYGAWILQLMIDFFPNQKQILITDLDKVAGWKTIPGWSEQSSIVVLELAERKGILRIDRQMKPWFIQAQIDIENAWKNFYYDIV